ARASGSPPSSGGNSRTAITRRCTAWRLRPPASRCIRSGSVSIRANRRCQLSRGADGPFRRGTMRQAILTDKAPKPMGPYSQAILENGFIFVAGQGCTNPATGKLELGDVRSETTRVFENIKAILDAAGSSLAQVVKVNVYLRDINDFAAMNEVYAT